MVIYYGRLLNMIDNLRHFDMEKYEFFHVSDAILLVYEKETNEIKICPNLSKERFVYTEPDEEEQKEITKNIATVLEYITTKYKILKDVPEFLNNNNRAMLDIHMCVKYLYARIQEFYDDTQKEKLENEEKYN